MRTRTHVCSQMWMLLWFVNILSVIKGGFEVHICTPPPLPTNAPCSDRNCLPLSLRWTRGGRHICIIASKPPDDHCIRPTPPNSGQFLPTATQAALQLVRPELRRQRQARRQLMQDEGLGRVMLRDEEAAARVELEEHLERFVIEEVCAMAFGCMWVMCVCLYVCTCLFVCAWLCMAVYGCTLACWRQRACTCKCGYAYVSDFCLHLSHLCLYLRVHKP